MTGTVTIRQNGVPVKYYMKVEPIVHFITFTACAIGYQIKQRLEKSAQTPEHRPMSLADGNTGEVP